MGTIGSVLLAEVLLGLLTTQPHSFLTVNPTWTPQKERVFRIASQNDESFQLRDILNFAKVPITRDDIEAIVR